MQRDNTVDFLKGMAILLVAIGHFNPVQQVGDFIYSFHMPLFFFLSGITFWYSYGAKLHKGNNIKSTLNILGKRFASLLLPYISWSIIRTYIYGMKISSTLLDSFDVLWFLPTLFGIIVIFSFTETGVNFIASKEEILKNIVLEIVFTAVLCGITLLLMKLTNLKLFREIIIYVIPFYMGFAFKKYDFVQKLFNNQFIITCCLIAFCILVSLYDRNDKSMSVLLIRFLTGIFAIIPLYSICGTYVQGGGKPCYIRYI